MKPSTDHDIETLNELIEVTLDSADGYHQAAEVADSAIFQGMFEQRARDRRQIVQRFQEQVSALGSEPDDDGSVLAAAHRAFLGLRDRLSEGDAAVIKEVERGEDFILDKFDGALADTELSGPVREIISTAYDSIRSGHDEVSALKKRTQSTAKHAPFI